MHHSKTPQNALALYDDTNKPNGVTESLHSFSAYSLLKNSRSKRKVKAEANCVKTAHSWRCDHGCKRLHD